MREHDFISHSRTQQAFFWLAALCLIAAGIFLSATGFLGKEWLSRSGCLVVALGIYSGLGGIIQERVVLGRLKLQQRLAISRATRKLRAQKADQAVIDQEVADIGSRFKEQIAALREDLRLSVGVLEVSLLVTGTLLWGFGDLFWIA